MLATSFFPRTSHLFYFLFFSLYSDLLCQRLQLAEFSRRSGSPHTHTERHVRSQASRPATQPPSSPAIPLQAVYSTGSRRRHEQRHCHPAARPGTNTPDLRPNPTTAAGGWGESAREFNVPLYNAHLGTQTRHKPDTGRNPVLTPAPNAISSNCQQLRPRAGRPMRTPRRLWSYGLWSYGLWSYRLWSYRLWSFKLWFALRDCGGGVLAALCFCGKLRLLCRNV